MMGAGKRSWQLRTVLSALMVVTTLVTVGTVGSLLLWIRIPQLEQESKEAIARETHDLTARVEILLGALESQIVLVGHAVQMSGSAAQSSAILDRAIGDGHAFRAIYLVSRAGTVRAAGLAPDLRSRREESLGGDLSANPLFVASRGQHEIVWSDKYLSGLSGAVTVGLAVPLDDGGILVAEVPLTYLLSTFELAAGQRSSSIWLVDRTGEIVADTQEGRSVGTVNMLNQPIVQAAIKGQPLPAEFRFEGGNYYPAVAHSKKLDWYFVAGSPAGLGSKPIQGAVIFVGVGFLGALLVGLLLAPFWASWFTKPLRNIVERAGQITRGGVVGQWPRGSIVEFNDLSSDLGQMADALQEREQKYLAIFNGFPVPMAVTDANNHYVHLDVNDAWCDVFGRQRTEVLGHTGLELGLFQSPESRAELREVPSLVGVGGSAKMVGESWLLHSNGTPILGQIYARMVSVGSARLRVVAMVDITELRRIENELRDLNTELEVRVAGRTQALETLNEELSVTVVNLRQTQAELVRAEKMAALGGLVAGVAHELNTPLGNGLLAVTSMGDVVREFRAQMQAGLKRSALEGFLLTVEQGADIATRNLQRAADLVSSFKQVAVDQTSSQRRSFELAEVVNEMVTSLAPSLRRTPYRLVVDVPSSGLRLDSYPGPLGQVLGNLINNAVQHGFDGRAHGVIRVAGMRAPDGAIVLSVADDGKGIPAALVPRIFDPFVTTKMGRGGTGLGLNIAYNAVVNLLGGTLSVTSVEGEGAVFEVRLAETAPLSGGDSHLA